MYYVSSFCQRALWLRNGRAEALGPAEDVIREYESFLVAKSAAAPHPEPGAESAAPRGPARIAAARLESGTRYENGQPWDLEVEWETEEPGLAFHVGVGINRSDEIEVCSFATHVDGLPPFTGERRYRVRLRIPRLPLVKGEFTLYVFLLDGAGLHIFDQRRLPRAFTVHSPRYAFGLIRADHDWDVEPRQLKSAV